MRPEDEAAGGPPVRPTPRLTPESEPYWEAAASGRLLLGSCAGCGLSFHPPQAVCPRCWASDIGLQVATGQGWVEAVTIVHQHADPAFQARVPYTVAWVALDEGPRLISSVVNISVDAVHPGQRVRVTFEAVGEHVAIPLFEPVGGEDRSG